MGGAAFFAPGAYSIAATYSGDGSFNPSTSPSTNFTITKASTNTTINIGACSPGNGVCIFNPGDVVAIFAWVNYTSPTGFSRQPTGTVTFYSNGMPVASQVSIDSGTIPPFASIATTQLLGPNSITAQYNSDSNYTGSTSSATMVEVGETFAMSVNPTAINVSSPGQSGSTTLTFAAQNGFTGSATLTPTMCSNLPPKSSCSFSPATVAFTSSTTSVPVTLTINTTAPSARFAAGQAQISGSSPASWEISAVFITGLCIIASAGRRPLRAIARSVALSVIASALACGGSGGGGGGTNPGTPPGNYYSVTITVTINGITQSINDLNVSVQ